MSSFLKRRLSQSSPSGGASPSSGAESSTPTLKVSSPFNPRPSPKQPVPIPLPPSLPVNSNSSSDTLAKRPVVQGSPGSGSSSPGGVISSIRHRARSFSSSARERAASTPNSAVAHSNPQTPPPAQHQRGSMPATGAIIPSSSAASTIGPDTPPSRAHNLPPSHSNSNSHSRTPTRHRSRSPPGTRSQSRSHSRPRFRDTSPPPLEGFDLISPGDPPPHHAFAPSISGWWDRTNDAESAHRPWKESIEGVFGRAGPHGAPAKRKATGNSLAGASPEQEEGWDLTRQRVALAARSVLGTTLDLAHEALLLSVDLLDLAPVPGLRAAAETLLNIWDSLQRVDMNRMACLRLTQRCADILISVRQEVQDAGGDVGGELQGPVDKLVESFQKVYHFLQKQTDRPFLKRYLKRDEILRQIAGCDTSLSDSVNTFSISIQIRILKQVQSLGSRLVSGGVLPPNYSPGPNSPPVPSPPATPAPPTAPHNDVLARLHAFRQQENERDATLDLVDLRRLLRTALQAGSDVQMIEVLQVGRDEMPEAIKTLQRALEREVEKDGAPAAAVDADPGPAGDKGKGKEKERAVGLGLEAEGRRASAPAASAAAGAAAGDGLERRKTVASQGTAKTNSWSLTASGSGSSGLDGQPPRDTLDREFIESGIDALRRVSRGPGSLPSWTITKYEIDVDENIGKIGMGYFSTVYKGTWRRRAVAIKVLATTTPHALFTREIAIWKQLAHPNVLELYGASSACGEPPWFFVSPYCKNGSLVSWLKSVKSFGGGAEDVDLLRCMHQVAKGMEYLHRKGVFHGDLKAANVLVDDNKRCLVSDFGQSEMRSEAYRLSGTPPPHGTLRWQAPEMMGGGHNFLTQEMDVYAFAICCVEILDMGGIPWQHHDDSAVVRFVLEENKRPSLPQTRVTTPALTAIINACWDRNPALRPPFKKIAMDLKQLRVKAGSNIETDSPFPKHPELFPDPACTHPSPDMRPIPLPGSASLTETFRFSSPPADDSFPTALESSPRTVPSPLPPRTDEDGMRESVPVIYTPSRKSSMFESSGGSLSSASVMEETVPALDGYESPPPADDRAKAIRDERRYRLLLTHEFHPSLTLPLWTPTPIKLGDVGYLHKPSGEFISLFNSISPRRSSNGFVNGMPSLDGYGTVLRGEQRQDKRNAAQRGFDALSGFLTFKSSARKNISRRISFPLREGHKAAYLCTESTRYSYITELEAPKKWFKANIDALMKEFGAAHRIQREDLFLVIGTLDAPDFALFVSHQHPDGQVHFNVFSAPRNGQNWGVFTADTELDLGGPSYPEELPGTSMSASKVSMVGGPNIWHTVVLARLRFKPDATEPTSQL